MTRKNLVDRNCIRCGAFFQAEKYRVDKGKALYCSHHCALSCRKKHGHSTRIDGQSITYNTYQNMIARCHRENSPKYHQYGAVGVTVCDRWRESFVNFLADMGERPADTTIDRKDGTLGYFKENCRWASSATQQSNLKSNVNITYKGVTKTVTDWSRELGIPTLSWRLHRGWPIEQAFNTQPKLGNRTIKTSQVLIEFLGETKCLSEWAREYNMSVGLLRLRLGKGWGIEKSLKEPKGKFVRKGDHLSTP